LTNPACCLHFWFLVLIEKGLLVYSFAAFRTNSRFFSCAVCLALFATSNIFAQAEDEDVEIITAWTQVAQEGKVSILGIARFSADRELTFDSAVKTSPVRIIPEIGDNVKGLGQIENSDESKSVFPVVMTGDYELKEGGEDSRRFSYRPATFSATEIRILEPEEIATVTEDVFSDKIRREAFKRRIVPLKLQNMDVYIEDLESKNEVAIAGTNRVEISTIYMTLRNFSRMPEDMEFEIPTLHVSDSEGEIVIAQPSELRSKNTDARRYNFLLKRKPIGDVEITICVTDDDGSEKTLDAVIPARPSRRNLVPKRGLPMPKRGIPEGGLPMQPKQIFR